MKNLASKIIHFMNGAPTITLSEYEMEWFMKVVEHLTIIETLEKVKETTGFDINKDVEEHRNALKELYVRCNLDSMLKENNLPFSPYCFFYRSEENE